MVGGGMPQKLPDPLERGPFAPGRPVGLEVTKEAGRGRHHVAQLNHQAGATTLRRSPGRRPRGGGKAEHSPPRLRIDCCPRSSGNPQKEPKLMAWKEFMKRTRKRWIWGAIVVLLAGGALVAA